MEPATPEVLDYRGFTFLAWGDYVFRAEHVVSFTPGTDLSADGTKRKNVCVELQNGRVVFVPSKPE